MATLFGRSDVAVQQQVMSELTWDTRVDASDIGVTVKNGIVTLTGTVETWSKRVAAQEAAHRVAGVLDVANELVVKPISTQIHDDTEIARQVRQALQWDVLVPDDRIRTTVEDGRVTLEGDVYTWAEREDAGRAIRNLAGVRMVENRLTVKPAPVRTEDLKQQITEALTRHAIREADRVHVGVSDGVVTLSGTVDSWLDRNAVTGAVRGTRGVRRVDDHQLHVAKV